MTKETIPDLVKQLEIEKSPYKLLKIIDKLGKKGKDAKSAIHGIEEIQEKFHHGDFGRWDEWESWHIDERIHKILEKIDPGYKEKA